MTSIKLLQDELIIESAAFISYQYSVNKIASPERKQGCVSAMLLL